MRDITVPYTHTHTHTHTPSTAGRPSYSQMSLRGKLSGLLGFFRSNGESSFEALPKVSTVYHHISCCYAWANVLIQFPTFPASVSDMKIMNFCAKPKIFEQDFYRNNCGREITIDIFNICIVSGHFRYDQSCTFRVLCIDRIITSFGVGFLR